MHACRVNEVIYSRNLTITGLNHCFEEIPDGINERSSHRPFLSMQHSALHGAKNITRLLHYVSEHRSGMKHFFDFLGEIYHGEWFLDKIDIVIERSVPGNNVSSIA